MHRYAIDAKQTAEYRSSEYAFSCLWGNLATITGNRIYSITASGYLKGIEMEIKYLFTILSEKQKRNERNKTELDCKNNEVIFY